MSLTHLISSRLAWFLPLWFFFLNQVPRRRSECYLAYPHRAINVAYVHNDSVWMGYVGVYYLVSAEN